ncbi:hypothetical protein R3P38DRAFT_2875736 [Favolaschia claudopus]|uniref:SnoaL-like domain-containing protein n=1 Tax=Favolaschia claudopus TaxID=2862362 RepID=A0AAW0D6G9_9AGAR
MASYTVADYLLDRVQIEETVTRLLWYADRKEWDKISSVFAENIVIDYTNLFGGEPVSTTGTDQAKAWKDMVNYLDATQHVASGLLMDLPQPSADHDSVQRPTEVKFTCNVFASHVKTTARGGPLLDIGGRYNIKAIRLTEALAGNPWRIQSLKAYGVPLSVTSDCLLLNRSFDSHFL